MNKDLYFDLKNKVLEAGYTKEIAWAGNIKPCDDAVAFFDEYAWVVINSGMKEQIARKIWNRILDAMLTGQKAIDVFGHKGKAHAIDNMWAERVEKFATYKFALNKLEYLKSLPWIGDITKYHLAKNLGLDCVKPDRHLVRIANHFKTTPEAMCKNLSEVTGDKIALVDTVIWRAANLGLVNFA